jgi:hypothetical protein
MKILVKGPKGINGYNPGQIMQVSEACGAALLKVHAGDYFGLIEYTGTEAGKPIIPERNAVNGLSGSTGQLEPVKLGPGRPKRGG